MKLLLTNDDGYFAPGLVALREWLSKYHKVIVVAPDRDRSGASHSLTVTRPLRVKKIEKDYYAVDGTPTDAVMIALNCVMKTKPDIIVSGINSGANMGEDVTYSGTVAAAIEGTLLGIPSIAVSLTGKKVDYHDKKQYRKAALFANRLIGKVKVKGLPEGVLLNVNVPGGNGVNGRNYRITRLGKRVYDNVITEKIDPRGEHYYWIAGKVRITGKGPDTDYGAVGRKYISVTPLAVDISADEFMTELATWKI
jgi:5'-nucleotidase